MCKQAFSFWKSITKELKMHPMVTTVLTFVFITADDLSWNAFREWDHVIQEMRRCLEFPDAQEELSITTHSWADIVSLQTLKAIALSLHGLLKGTHQQPLQQPLQQTLLRNGIVLWESSLLAMMACFIFRGIHVKLFVKLQPSYLPVTGRFSGGIEQANVFCPAWCMHK
jgi:hypothetical protein